MIDETPTLRDERFMRQALMQAEQAAAAGEVPVGAVVVSGGRVIAAAHNLTQRLNDVTAHAEMLALTAAADALGGKYLTDCTIYVTVEPCIMCAGALGWSQIGRVVWGASDDKRGYHVLMREGETPFHPKTETTAGVLADECGEIVTSFFRRRRRR